MTDHDLLKNIKRPVSDEYLAEVFRQFRHDSGTFVEGGPYGNGHINDTFAVTAEDIDGFRRRFILQRINTEVFQKPGQLMDNISRVTSHLNRKYHNISGSEPARQALTLIPTDNGAPYFRTPENECWRLYIFIENATSYDVVQTSDQGYEAARAYGAFQRQLADLPGPPLHAIIPDFHHTPKRLQKLHHAMCNDTFNRRVKCEPELKYALSLSDEAGLITGGLEAGTLPECVTHNDTKLNNVLLDDATGKGVCVIDLDTVMPGSCLYDFGDLVRSAAGDFAENCCDLDSVQLDLDRYRAIVAGFLESTASVISDKERQMLPDAAMLMTYEVGIRFLTDFLEGDWYFKTSDPDENLRRARVQLGFVKQIRSQRIEMSKRIAT